MHWADSEGTRQTSVKAGETRALRLSVTFDKTRAKSGESIVCNVRADRIGFAGYGMMLAEIGPPPGVDVDREALGQALEKSQLDHFDGQPDRIILHLGPRAAGRHVEFS